LGSKAMTDAPLPSIVISTTLPICLHLGSRTFRIPHRSNTEILISTENIFSEEPTYLGTAKNAEVDSDTFSHFRFTRIAVGIPELGAPTNGGTNILEAHKKAFFKALNHFIDAAWAALDRPGQRNYFDFQILSNLFTWKAQASQAAQ